ncbi:MAG: shikimate kinase [Zoogloeaceae bacterium]|nr:shikimate kinase [Zoogloeaceae bacterium]
MEQATNNIYLIGLMGSGKTTIGRHIARRLGRAFLDSDHEIETRTGVRIPTIFEIEGEAGFRRREAQVIAALAEEEDIVLATGGGVVLDPGNRALLRQRGWIVYLNVPPEQLFVRTRLDRNRPLLQVESPLRKLEELYALRDPLYREIAHFVVEDVQPPASVVQLILKAFACRCVP